MALQITKVLVDDMDGTPENEKPVKTRRFTLDGTQYEIDLHDDTHAGLVAAVAAYVEKARVISRPKQVTPTGAATSKKQQARIDKAQLDHMREWLRSHGYKVSPFGRVPVSMEATYREHLESLKGNGAHAASDPERSPEFSSV